MFKTCFYILSIACIVHETTAGCCSIREIFYKGNSDCEKTCDDPNQMRPCPRMIKPGCVCRDEFFRNKAGDCVKGEDCDSCGGDPNAFVARCGDPCPTTCENKDDTRPRPCPAICHTNGCKCKKGFVLGPDKKCIDPKKCPPKCKPNEVFKKNINSDCQRTCEDPNSERPCAAIIKPGCVCIDGYFRNRNGECVKGIHCDSCRGDLNAIVSGCGDPCPTTCENRFEGPRPCPYICIPNGCRCREGFILGPNKKCILPKNCPKPSCSPREEFLEHGNRNCEKTCDDPNQKRPCPRIIIPGCVCKKEFFRNAKGECVKGEDCNSCRGDPNAFVAVCGDPCPTTCANKDDTRPRPCPKICHVNGCKCKQGFILGPDNKCIDPKNCPKPRCPPNEVFLRYGNSNCEKTCDDPDQKRPCPTIVVPGCVCKKEFFRNDKGECVKGEDCNRCRGDPNAFIADCGDPCPTTCENKDDTKPRPCPMICHINGCKCKKGFVLGPYNKCIDPKDCRPKCKSNEVFKKYINSDCQRTCEDPNSERPCPAMIKPGCVCIDGYFRNGKGECVKGIDCDSCRGDPNAIVSGCGDPCPTTCENRHDEQRPCPFICIPNGCKCKKGFVLGPNKKCVRQEACPKISCGRNEVFDGCIRCLDKTCSNLAEGTHVPCLLIGGCRSGCRCRDGYVRNSAGNCVEPKDCCDDPNAEFIKCPNPCPGGTCAHPCFLPCKMKCMPYGCQCKKGYLKKSDTDKTCIRKEECPKDDVLTDIPIIGAY